jgi:hypothetical protein
MPVHNQVVFPGAERRGLTGYAFFSSLTGCAETAVGD